MCLLRSSLTQGIQSYDRENLGGEAGLIEERKKKLKLLRDSNKAYVNDFDRTHRAEIIIAEYQGFSKAELEEKTSMASTLLVALCSSV